MRPKNLAHHDLGKQHGLWEGRIKGEAFLPSALREFCFRHGGRHCRHRERTDGRGAANTYKISNSQ